MCHRAFKVMSIKNLINCCWCFSVSALRFLRGVFLFDTFLRRTHCCWVFLINLFFFVGWFVCWSLFYCGGDLITVAQGGGTVRVEKAIKEKSRLHRRFRLPTLAKCTLVVFLIKFYITKWTARYVANQVWQKMCLKSIYSVNTRCLQKATL